MLIYSETFYRPEKPVNGHLKFHGCVGIGTVHVFLPPFNLTLSCIILKDENSLPFTAAFLPLGESLDCACRKVFATNNLYDLILLSLE